MDAWRYRDDDGGAFDRFWRSVVAEGVAAGARRCGWNSKTRSRRPGSRQSFTLRYRSMTAGDEIEASAVARSRSRAGNQVMAGGAPGVMRGELPIGDHGACTVEAAVNDVRVTRGIAVCTACLGLPTTRSPNSSAGHAHQAAS